MCLLLFIISLACLIIALSFPFESGKPETSDTIECVSNKCVMVTCLSGEVCLAKEHIGLVCLAGEVVCLAGEHV